MPRELPIRIIRDVVDRTGLATLRNIAAEHKADQSPVTETDALVETIVLEHLRLEFGNDFVLVGEESSGINLPTIGEIRRAPLLVTIDGIDGTTEFVRHVNRGDHNPLWLLAMTAVYRRNASGRLQPLLAFAYQPHADCLFCYCEGQTELIEHPLTEVKSYRFDIGRLPLDKPRGSIDVYLPKPECPHELTPGVCSQMGPSGYNMASLLASCAVGYESKHTAPVNFTSFHYNLWDFALWPILQTVGFATADYEDQGRVVAELQPELWGDNAAHPSKILRPLIISPPALLPQLAGAIQLRRSR